jgi:hypothetical protein
MLNSGHVMRSLLVVGFLGAVAGAAHARPGGGGHFSGGGHSGGGHSGGGGHYSSGGRSGGGSGDPTAPLVLLGISSVVIGAVAYRKLKQRPSSGDGALAGEPSPSLPPVSDGALGVLEAHDPGFDRARFGERTLAVMRRVNEAWCAEDMGAARALVSDGVFVRFQTYLALLAASGLRNAMGDWNPISADIVGVESDQRWDTLHVLIRAEARDRDVDRTLSREETARKVSRAPLEPYEEVWSLVRRRGATSPADVIGGAVEGVCAKCGAPQPRSQTVRCATCGAVSNSGEHDWVLAEITQVSVAYHLGTSAQVLGLDALRADDPDLSRQELEDRASVVFWKWIEARVTGSRTKLERFCATPGKPEAPRAELRDVAVGSCDAGAARRTETHDKVDLDVIWSAFERDEYLHRVTLIRARGATSRRGLSCLDCPECGGELASSDDVTCRYCGTALRAGASDWALAAIELVK